MITIIAHCGICFLYTLTGREVHATNGLASLSCRAIGIVAFRVKGNMSINAFSALTVFSYSYQSSMEIRNIADDMRHSMINATPTRK